MLYVTLIEDAFLSYVELQTPIDTLEKVADIFIVAIAQKMTRSLRWVDLRDARITARRWEPEIQISPGGRGGVSFE
jgi:hypothetical protein